MTKLTESTDGWPKFYCRDFGRCSYSSLVTAHMTVMVGPRRAFWYSTTTSVPGWRTWWLYNHSPDVYTRPEDEVTYTMGMDFFSQYSEGPGNDQLPPEFLALLRAWRVHGI